MSFKTQLDRIWESYQVMCDCLKIAQRGVIEKNMRLLKKTGFLSSSEEDARNQMQKAEMMRMIMSFCLCGQHLKEL